MRSPRVDLPTFLVLRLTFFPSARPLTVSESASTSSYPILSHWHWHWQKAKAIRVRVRAPSALVTVIRTAEVLLYLSKLDLDLGLGFRLLLAQFQTSILQPSCQAFFALLISSSVMIKVELDTVSYHIISTILLPSDLSVGQK